MGSAMRKKLAALEKRLSSGDAGDPAEEPRDRGQGERQQYGTGEGR